MDYQLSKEELRETKPSRDEFLKEKRFPIVCILDNLSVTHNVGVIIRLCEAFRIEKIYICGDTPTLQSRKIRASSVGTEKWIDIEYNKSTLHVIEDLKQEYKVLAVELTKEAPTHTSMNYETPTAFIFGNENIGVNDDVIKSCDGAVFVEMFGMGNSINVSSCASIIIADAVSKTSKIV